MWNCLLSPSYKNLAIWAMIPQFFLAFVNRCYYDPLLLNRTVSAKGIAGRRRKDL